MNLPAWVYSLAFWKALTFAVAGLLALLGFFGVIPANFVISAEVLLAGVLTFLNLLGIKPELQAKATEVKLARAEKLLKEAAVLRNDLLGVKSAETRSKPASRR